MSLLPEKLSKAKLVQSQKYRRPFTHHTNTCLNLSIQKQSQC